MGRLIDADKLKQHYAWWEGKMEVTKEDIDTIIDLQPTIEAVPTDFHDKCQQLEIQKRFKLEEDYRSMEQTVNKLTEALAEAEPIRHGKWEEIKSGDWANATEYRCSECGKYRLAVNPVNYNWNYCPNCGAKMDAGDTYSTGHNERDTEVTE